MMAFKIVVLLLCFDVFGGWNAEAKSLRPWARLAGVSPWSFCFLLPCVVLCCLVLPCVVLCCCCCSCVLVLLLLLVVVVVVVF